MGAWNEFANGDWNPAGDIDAVQHDHHWTRMVGSPLPKDCFVFKKNTVLFGSANTYHSYPIVAETPSGRLRYKTIVIGRFVYNLTGIFTNSVTPRMLSPVGKSPSQRQDRILC